MVFFLLCVCFKRLVSRFCKKEAFGSIWNDLVEWIISVVLNCGCTKSSVFVVWFGFYFHSIYSFWRRRCYTSSHVSGNVNHVLFFQCRCLFSNMLTSSSYFLESSIDVRNGVLLYVTCLSRKAGAFRASLHGRTFVLCMYAHSYSWTLQFLLTSIHIRCTHTQTKRQLSWRWSLM